MLAIAVYVVGSVASIAVSLFIIAACVSGIAHFGRQLKYRIMG